MKVDRYREVVRRICGSLDLDKALFDVFQFLRDELTLDALAITRYETERKRARLIALAYADGGFLVDEAFPLSNAAWESISAWQRESRSATTPWIRDHTHPINREIFRLVHGGISGLRLLNTGIFSSMTCGLTVDHTLIGNLTFAAEGKELYHARHAEIVTEVKEPFAIALSNALRYMDLVQDHKALQRENTVAEVMVGGDTGLREVRSLVSQVAPTDTPVLLLGETGTGKEVVAAEVHKLSSRSAAPLVRLNCGAIADSLVDSELFGHEKGAFTGAIETKPGRFERANGGTLFLDEIGELPLSAQVKLLRVLQSGEFERVGGGKTLRTNVRIIAATHRKLPEMVEAGRFRQDLWYRLNIFPVEIPPLRDRKDDIPLLVEHFIRSRAREMNLGEPPVPAEGEMEALLAYDWPGNVRELQNLVERALILFKGGPLRFPVLTPSHQGSPSSLAGAWSPQDLAMDAAIKGHIRFVLGKTRGRIAGPGGAAELLNMNPNTLRSRMKKLGISFPAERGPYRRGD
ncbi:sigma-54 interaction domain-containing protein [Desulfoluna spongiiphila]|uniref:sigma-54 interaction domain-containing protein n=1 Tax=Desulfoluna spongiiphila TaxID=419481 RepID=UPI00125C5FEA|nr:sigma 54-interacting transcriptional regulator [Desulfoluna spongiiphila]VVS91130.1 rna polymerase sigma factor 54 interaction domain [Desulfoluna spongiiphila]